METEFDNINLTEIVFLKKLFSSRYSVIFLINVHNQKCVMKVVSKAEYRIPDYMVSNLQSTTEEDPENTTNPKTVNWTSMYSSPPRTVASKNEAFATAESCLTSSAQ